MNQLTYHDFEKAGSRTSAATLACKAVNVDERELAEALEFVAFAKRRGISVGQVQEASTLVFPILQRRVEPGQGQDLWRDGIYLACRHKAHTQCHEGAVCACLCHIGGRA